MMAEKIGSGQQEDGRPGQSERTNRRNGIARSSGILQGKSNVLHEEFALSNLPAQGYGYAVDKA